MQQINNTEQNLSWWEKKGEDIVNLALGLAITLCTVWGLYIGISLLINEEL